MTEASGAVVVEKGLDALVAERVMGWKSDHTAHNYACDPPRSIRGWRPSTHIQDAWRVVERMRELGFTYSVTDTIIGNVVVHFWAKAGEPRHGSAEEKSVTRAICLAALKAVSAAGALREKGTE